MAEELPALRAKVETYELELQHVFVEGQKAVTAMQASEKSTDESTRDAAMAWSFMEIMQIVTRRSDLVDKYAAAQRNYTRALEKRVRQLEKESPKFDLGIDP